MPAYLRTKPETEGLLIHMYVPVCRQLSCLFAQSPVQSPPRPDELQKFRQILCCPLHVRADTLAACDGEKWAIPSAARNAANAIRLFMILSFMEAGIQTVSEFHPD
jgi:hypothetical protein